MDTDLGRPVVVALLRPTSAPEADRDHEPTIEGAERLEFAVVHEFTLVIHVRRRVPLSLSDRFFRGLLELLLGELGRQLPRELGQLLWRLVGHFLTREHLARHRGLEYEGVVGFLVDFRHVPEVGHGQDVGGPAPQHPALLEPAHRDELRESDCLTPPLRLTVAALVLADRSVRIRVDTVELAHEQVAISTTRLSDVNRQARVIVVLRRREAGEALDQLDRRETGQLGHFSETSEMHVLDRLILPLTGKRMRGQIELGHPNPGPLAEFPLVHLPRREEV